MTNENMFKWKHFQGELILLNVRWYCCYALSYRNLVEMMEERGMNLSHTTIMRWVHQYAVGRKKSLNSLSVVIMERITQSRLALYRSFC